MMKRRGMTLVEIIMALMIMAISTAVVAVNINNFSGQSARSEADKLMNWISARQVKADLRNMNFDLEVSNSIITINWRATDSAVVSNTETFTASNGCEFSWNGTPSGNKLTYSGNTNAFATGGSIAVTGKGDAWYVIAAAIGSRVRVDSTPASE